MNFLVVLFLLVIFLMVAVWLYIARQGDAEFAYLVKERTDFLLSEATDSTATFTCQVPFLNKGTQDGTIMDAYTRHLLPQEQYDAAEVSSRLMLERAPRNDGYWEALIVPKTTGGIVIVTVKFTSKQGDIRRDLRDLVDMPIDLVYQVVARSEWYIAKTRMLMTAEEIQRAMQLAPAGE
ncbi:Hypothetical protein LUCI_1739 [Lucifera butyrica]|uniref:Uncharacterized protein n=1 Tax=Lucifera butyrica TaxID=1351585 RepID=A0A498R1M4_9FIRM|nr:hypothetical protein [Lucifera butyrica]VBB06506.1 Hypothetical protein LUCI_1739 [Lucifera butyrica]